MNVPDLPIDEFVTADRKLSDVGKNFFQQLISQLQNNFSNEGLVAPTQSSTNITIIQNNQNGTEQYTCSYGTILYNSTGNSIQIAINNGSNVPIFKTVTLT